MWSCSYAEICFAVTPTLDGGVQVVSRESSCLPIEDRVSSEMVVRDLDHWLPAETRRIVNEMQLRLRPTVEYDVEPVVVFQTFCRFVLVVAERDLTDGR